MRSKIPYGPLIILAWLFLAPLPSWAMDLLFQKGPFLHLSKDKLVVRFQPLSPVSKPELEFRKKGDSDAKKTAFQPQAMKFWKAELPEGQEEYRVIDGESTSPWYPVMTPGKPEMPFVFVAYGDNRTGGGDSKVHQRLLDQIAKESPSFVIHTGDLTFRGDFEAYWDQFYAESKRLYSSVPFEPVMGNHDLSPGRRFAYYFNLGDKDATYYYFDYGKAHFIALDTTLKFTEGSDQYKFLKDHLEKFKADSPLIVYFHHPAHSSSRHGSDSKVLQVLVPLFEKYGVDLVLNGHDHGYQRFGPINGVTYIVSGGGGAPIYRIQNDPDSKSSKEVYHYVVFQVDESTIRVSMKENFDTVDDTFEIVYAPENKTQTPKPAKPKTKGRATVPAL